MKKSIAHIPLYLILVILWNPAFSAVTPSSPNNNFKISVETFTPATQATSIIFSSVDTDQMDISWTDGDGGNRIVVVKAGSAVDSNPTDATTYSANASFGSGSQIGSGNYVVYDGTGSSFTLTGLSANTTYYVRVFEYDAGPSYNVNTATGNPGSQATLDEFQVTNTNDSGTGSLRWAIDNANASGSKETIDFNIPGAGPWTITLASLLPYITNASGVIIDGTTQPGWTFGDPDAMVTIDANGFGYGINITTIDTEIYGLVLTGSSTALNMAFGHDGAIIGAANKGNIISGNSWSGIAINGSDNITIQGNRIGTSVDGLSTNGNTGSDGINIRDSDGSLIGGDMTAGEGNVISANGSGSGDYGIEIWNNNNLNIYGNLIGTDVSGNNDFGNYREGILLATGDNINIGGTGTGQGNVVSGNGNNGIWVAGGTNVKVKNNIVGLNLSGNSTIANAMEGIYLTSSGSGIEITGNTVSGNGNRGIALNTTATNEVTVTGNYVGTDPSGTAGPGGLGNQGSGIQVSNMYGISFAQPIWVSNNVVSGNGLTFGYGLNFFTADYIIAQNNIVGLEADGVTPYGNSSHGFALSSGNNFQIGGIGNENIIAHNGGDGIYTSLAAFDGGKDVQVNKYFCNGGLGINIANGSPSVTPPVVTTISAGVISGTSVEAAGSDIHVYEVDPACADNQGYKYLGTTTVSGAAWSLTTGYNSVGIVATVTDATNGISEFSAAMEAPDLIVTTINDTGAGSLRQAILDANSRAGTDDIIFDGSLDGLSISVASIMTIAAGNGDGTTIDGDIDGDGDPDITLTGGAYSGIEILADNCQINGLNIIAFSGAGNAAIDIDGGTGNTITGNYIGTNLAGTAVGTLNLRGVAMVNSASGNFIGDGTAAGQNVISNNTYGVYIDGSDDNTVSGNIIGLDINGTTDLGNGISGVEVVSSDGTLIGINGDAVNVISGNSWEGISLTSSTNTKIVNNYIGTSSDGSTDLGNTREGIWVDATSTPTQIGDGTAGGRNVISGNDYQGIEIASDGNTVSGNYIGLNAAGGSAIANSSYGIWIASGATGNTIGGGTSGERNVISGNGAHGILLSDGPNYIYGNYIGLNAAGTLARGNSGIGISVGGGTNSKIGDAVAGFGNVISGNTNGIQISVSGVEVYGNTIGMNAAGTAARANSGDGISLASNASGVQIGDGTAVGANLISGNTGEGILINGALVSSNVITGNNIGVESDLVTAAGNGANGILIESDANANTISLNIIANNGDNGIEVSQLFATATENNTFSQNSIFNNTNLGISIISGQNSIAAPTITSTLDGLIVGTSDANATIEIFADASDEGEQYLATTTADGIGDWSIQITLTGINSGLDNINAIQTSSSNTSEMASSALVLSSLYQVVNTNDSGTGSLRWCVGNANTVAGTNTITFSPSVDGGVIMLDSEIILTAGNGDGTTINGDIDGNNTPNITIQPTGAGYDGLRILSDNNIIEYLHLQGFTGANVAAIDIFIASSNQVLGNYLGSNLTGTAAGISNNIGISIFSGSDHEIGDGTIQGANVIGNNSIGIEIGVSNNGKIVGNMIGVALDGTTIIGNTADGIEVDGGSGMNIGEIGGIVNVISGNANDGIYMNGAEDAIIVNNHIGVDISGLLDLGNVQNGIRLTDNSDNATIGGNTAGLRNIISGNTRHGIQIDGTTGALVIGNYIGLGIDGSTIIGNDLNGVFLDGGYGNQIGNESGGTNVISGNTQNGIDASDDDSQIYGNYIGTNAAGTAAKGNVLSGIQVGSGSGLKVGDAVAGRGNVISGNTTGIADADGVSILGNYIGLNATGDGSIPNSDGIRVTGSSNIIGDGTALGTNVISGNNNDGIYLRLASGSIDNNSIQTNIIGLEANGTDPLGNGDNGIYLGRTANNNTILDNIIASNVSDGIELGEAGATDILLNTLSQNSIYNNGNQGILITNGAQGGILPPTISSVTTTTISGTGVIGETVEVFANNTSSTPQGETYLGTAIVDGAGDWQVTSLLAFAASDLVTATASNGTDGTSEFSSGMTIDPPGNALHFDGNNDFVDGGNDASLYGHQNITLEAWVNPDFTLSNAEYDLISTIGTAGGHGYQMSIGNDGKPNLFFRNAAISDMLLIASSALTENEWSHVAGVIENAGTSTNLYIYINGQLDASSTVASIPAYGSAGNLVLGSNGDGAAGSDLGVREFNGIMDEARIWSSARSSTEIQNNRYSTLVGNEANLVAYYRFDQGTAGVDNSGITTLPDRSQNLNDGTLSNFTLNGTASNWVESSAFTPIAPTNLFTTEVSTSRIDLDWTDNSFNETDFIIERSDGDNTNFVQIAMVEADAPTYSDFTVTPGNGYYYRIIAKGSSANSNPSNEKFGSTITPLGNALNFDGVDDYVAIADTDNLSFGNGTSDTPFTVEAWINLADATAFPILYKGSNGNREFNFRLTGTDPDKLSLTLFGPTSNDKIGVRTVSTLTSDENSWIHVAATYDGSGNNSNIKLYRNGILLAVDGTHPTDNGGSYIAMSNTAFGASIGRSFIDGPNFGTGNFDEIRLWDVVRTQTEIQNNMLSTLVGNEANLAAYYRFDQGIAGAVNTGITTLPDRSQNQNDGTLTGFDMGAADVDISNWVNSETFSNSFITTWSTTDGQITIPTAGAGYNYDITWTNLTTPLSGNGSSTGETGDITITGLDNGDIYQIEITGDFPRIYFFNTGDKDKILSVEQWGDIAWTSMVGAFYGCSNLTVPAVDVPDLSTVTDLSYMFRDAVTFNANINGWDVSNVTYMGQLFYGATSFNQDIGSWDVSNVTDISSMFGNAIVFNQDIGGWDVGNVLTMNTLFSGASSFNQDIGSWDVSNVTTMVSMFSDATSFNQNIGPWGAKVANVTNMNGMFVRAAAFNQDIGSWDVSSVTNFSSMFTQASSFNQDIGGWNVAGASNFGWMFYLATSFNQDIGSWDMTNLTYMSRMFRNATVFNQDLSSWNVSNVTDMYQVFAFASAFNQDISTWDVSNVTTMYQMFYAATVFNQDISGWDVGLAENMSQMFANAGTFDKDISGWNVGLVENMSQMFMNATSFNQNLGGWDISSVTSMPNMLNNSALSVANYDATLIGWEDNNGGETIPTGITLGATGLNYCNGASARTSLEGTYSWTITDAGQTCLPFITTWSTTDGQITIPTTGAGYNYDITWTNLTNAGVGDGSITGQSTDYLITGLSNGDTYRVEISGNFPSIRFANVGDKDKILTIEQWGDIAWGSMNSAFYGCSNLTYNAVDSPDLTGVTQMGAMFFGATLFNGDLSGWNTSSVTNMNSMFNSATAFNQDISTWDVSEVTHMIQMFSSASAFNQDLSGWDVSKVLDMSTMFSAASSFDNGGQPLTWGLKTGAVTNMIGMFQLTPFNQDISSWDVSSVSYMHYMFYNATSFNQDIGSWNVISVTDMNRMFYGATSFNNGGQPLTWGTSTGAVTDMSWMFYNTASFNQDIGSWNVMSATDMNNMFYLATSFNNGGQPLTWGTSTGAVTDMNRIFYRATAFNQDVSGWDVSAVTDMSGMFLSASSFNNGGQPLTWGASTGAVTDMNSIFNSATAFNQDVSGWDVSAVTNMSGMFLGTTSFNNGGLPLDWGTSTGAVTDMSWMFAFAVAFDQNIGSWTVGNVDNMGSMFRGAITINQDISGWTVSSVVNMAWTFEGATSFDQNLGGWDISSVSDMTFMLDNSGLSVTNYDATLVGWEALPSVQSGVTLGATNLDYCTGETARQNLIDTHGWTISGDALNCPLVGGVYESDYNALIALYNATDGANWTDNTNWLSANPVSTWYGVTAAGNRVTEVVLEFNNLMGTLPTELGYLTGSLQIDLEGNTITGSIPVELGSISTMTQLDLSDNQLTGGIPSALGNIAVLSDLNLGTNQLSDPIPIEIWGLTNLTILDIDHNLLTGTIPTDIGNLTLLTRLELDDNQFNGSIPVEIGTSLLSLQRLDLGFNQFTGSIPIEFGNLTSMEYLFLEYNLLTGGIPTEIGNLTNLISLELDNNQLTGSIPTAIGNLVNLDVLDLGYNLLDGSIPVEIASLTVMTELDLSNNQLTGSIPSVLGGITSLTNLDIGTNQLSGSIPIEIWNLTNLEILEMDHNLFEGAVSDNIGNLTQLFQLELDDNLLTGAIPTTIGNLTLLTDLQLQDNQFTGAVPIEFQNLTLAEDIRVQNNQLDDLPDLSGLANLTQFEIDSCNFHFDDIEPNVGIAGIVYSPQNQITGPGAQSLTQGNPLNLSFTIGGSANQYQWVKDGTDITGETSDNFSIASVTPSDAGTYYLSITSSAVSGLTLRSEDIVVSVASSEISVYQGADNLGIEITSNQTSAIDFGTTVQGSDITLPFAIENTGTMDLTISSISSSDPVFVVSGAPSMVSSGSTSSFSVLMDALSSGTFTSTITITNDDLDEGSFTFDIGGVVAAEEIVIYIGEDITGPVIESSSSLDIGRTFVDIPIERTFTLENPSSTEMLVITDVTIDDPVFSVTQLPTSIDPSGSDFFMLELDASQIGSFEGTLMITSNFATFTFDLFAEVEKIKHKIHVYNIVTPNGDAKHDYLQIAKITEFPNNRVAIFDRLGNRVYQASGYNNDSVKFEGLDTEGDGELLPSGTYFYVIDLGSRKKESGFIQLSIVQR